MEENHEFWPLAFPWCVKFWKEASIPWFYTNLRHRFWCLSLKVMGPRKMLVGPTGSFFFFNDWKKREWILLFWSLFTWGGIVSYSIPLAPRVSEVLRDRPSCQNIPCIWWIKGENARSVFFPSQLFKFKNTGTDQTVASVKMSLPRL